VNHPGTSRPARFVPVLAVLGVVWGSTACGPDAPAPDAPAHAGVATSTNTSTPAAPVRVSVHAHGERLDALRAALDGLDRARAAELIDAASAAGPEEPLLRARFQALEPAGTIAALRLIETARAADPKNPDVYATAAEIYAANDAFDTAWQEIERGLASCGESAELLRARGVAWLCREHGAPKGVEFLTRARAADPDLPFVTRALAQGHLLVAKIEQQKKNVEGAIANARASLAGQPDNVDARRLLSELLAAQGDFGGAIAIVQGLVQAGEPLEAELASLCKKAGIAALLENDRPRAIEQFRAARAHGLNDTELASGARILAEESRVQLERGVAAYEKGDTAKAETCFREALADEPTSLAARNHLAVVLFGRAQYPEAARLWREVLETARTEAIDLPDPVHLNLAAALAKSGDAAGARAVLEEFLKREPTGEWARATRDALNALGEAGR